MANEQPKFNIGESVVWYKNFDDEFNDGILCTVVDVNCTDENEIVYSLADENGNITENVSRYVFKRDIYDNAIKNKATERKVNCGFVIAAISLLIGWVALFINTFAVNQPFEEIGQKIALIVVIAQLPLLAVLIRFARAFVIGIIYGRDV